MKKKLSLLILAVVTAALTLTGCGSAKDKEAAAEDVFRVGMEAGYAPFNWTQTDDSNGAVKINGGAEYAGGYDVEIAKKIADSLGKKLVIVKTEWDGLVPALTSGKIDAIIAGMSPTAERKETIDFTDIYYKSDLVMLVKKGGAYENAETLKDFSGAKITGQLNTFHYSVIDQIPNVKKQTAMDNFPAMRVALESGVIDGYVTERPEALSAQMANENFKMVEFKEGFETSEEDTAIAVGVKKDSELKDKINEILKGISDTERLEIMDTAIKNQPAAQ
ncbi:transporter substrate-binding domain-containing protein [Clostridium nigeriense]|uniref:transporter substrate-binding domain-containing protein n=1 Tax=Clostridium nigeriense TaxID=1805470 RepID=UPI0008302C02|nr:transporter substrate-binding domain-containing protein [Clostridium nigeriense]